MRVPGLLLSAPLLALVLLPSPRSDATPETNCRAALSWSCAPPECLAIGDLNGDGAPDLVRLSHGEANRLIILLNQDGQLRRPASHLCPGLQSYAEPAPLAAIRDENGDGWPDLELVTGASHERIALFLNRGQLRGAWLGLVEAR